MNSWNCVRSYSEVEIDEKALDELRPALRTNFMSLATVKITSPAVCSDLVAKSFHEKAG
jgi:hypothetical protein